MNDNLMIFFLILILILIVYLIIALKKLINSNFDKKIENLLIKTWHDLGLSEKISELSLHAKEIKDSYRSLELLLKSPTERGALGELALENILSDQLPPEMYGIRKRVLDGKIPDAFIRSPTGIICIDSKFPLENYRKIVESKSEEEKEKLKRAFLRDVKLHLEKVLSDYIQPHKGSAEFVFVYIPSESVYNYLLTHAHDLLLEYSKKGVLVVSPLTLSIKLVLVKTGVYAKKLSENAEKIKSSLLNLSHRFKDFEQAWNIFYRTHLRNLINKADELDELSRNLNNDFERINNFLEDSH